MKESSLVVQLKPLKTTSNYVTQKVMASYPEESSPIEYSESCCICDENFSSDFELTYHLIEHANEEKYKSSLKKFEQKILATDQHQSGVFMNQSMKSLRKRSTSPEMVDLLSDESDDESRRNKKQATNNETKNSSPATNNQVKADAVNNAIKPIERPQNPVQTNSTPKAAQSGVYNCTPCIMVFKNLKLYKKHLSNHEKAGPYACPSCDSKFASKYSLQQHLDLHTEMKSYECKVCHKIFASKQTLSRHEETHKLKQR
ncbi:putative zinc finger protein 840 [Argiope bruennichi]|uniref:putative zinc finger protein 840 n=1 Tax=Argiope bruennichi TaxID=94029 RepID=UPI0024957D14|nr:putative zinc finger protein 840 [Argiope bruennichi]XP_055948330.1 putative zinc finger protein 840 [Argiope bruennichi]XP_055948331.1 putative zinc finger protein 840 [Argiope bruennichi]